MRKVQSFMNSGNCRSVILLVFILAVHAYIKIKEYTREKSSLQNVRENY